MHSTRPDFNTVTFEGTIDRVVPQNGKYSGDPESRSWIIWVLTTTKLRSEPVMIKFVTKQEPIPYLIAEGRMGQDFKLTVTGRLSSIQTPCRASKGHNLIHLSNAFVDPENLWYHKEVLFTVSSSGDYSADGSELVEF